MSIEVQRDDLERALGRRVSTYEVEAIDPQLRLHSVTKGVYRVRAGDDSVVLKVIHHGADGTADGLWLSGEDVTHRNYWKREWLAFDSGLVDSLPGRLRAPKTLLTTQHGDDFFVWMADIGGRTARELTFDDYALIAHALGTTQGAYAAGRTPLPTHEWLSRGWLRGWVDACAPMLDDIDDDAAWLDERVAALDPLRPRIRRLSAAREDLFTIVESAPQTLVHLDFWPMNLFVGDGVVTAIDWSQIGVGALAQDLDQIALDAVWMQIRPASDLAPLEDVVMSAYLPGLDEAGLDVAPADVWRWYAAAAALKYAWMVGGLAATMARPDGVRHQEERFGLPWSTIVEGKAAAAARAVELGEQALA